MNRKKQINERFKLFAIESDGQAHYYSFLSGAQWADANPSTEVMDAFAYAENWDLERKLYIALQCLNDYASFETNDPVSSIHAKQALEKINEKL